MDALDQCSGSSECAATTLLQSPRKPFLAGAGRGLQTVVRYFVSQWVRLPLASASIIVLKSIVYIPEISFL